MLVVVTIVVMFNIFRKKKDCPKFEALAGFINKDLYFVRTAQWNWLDEDKIFAIDPVKPRMLTLDPWPQIIFLAADGQLSVTEYINYVAGKYSGNIPENLDRTIIDELLKLESYQIIKFVAEQCNPEILFDKPGALIK